MKKSTSCVLDLPLSTTKALSIAGRQITQPKVAKLVEGGFFFDGVRHVDSRAARHKQRYKSVRFRKYCPNGNQTDFKTLKQKAERTQLSLNQDRTRFE